MGRANPINAGQQGTQYQSTAGVWSGKENMKKLLLFIPILFASCTYTISMVHTQGEATDVIDETSTPTANVSPTVNVPASLLP